MTGMVGVAAYAVTFLLSIAWAWWIVGRWIEERDRRDAERAAVVIAKLGDLFKGAGESER